MNKIELLPKEIFWNDSHFQLRMWVTAWNRLCIGYKNILNTDPRNKFAHLFSVCVEPENEPSDIKEYGSGWLNEGIGNAVSVDDACEMILKYIEKHNDEFKCY